MFPYRDGKHSPRESVLLQRDLTQKDPTVYMLCMYCISNMNVWNVLVRMRVQITDKRYLLFLTEKIIDETQAYGIF